MSTAQKPFPECGFRFSLAEVGIVFEATAQVRDRLQTYFVMRAAGAGAAMYDGKSFHSDMAKSWGYGGNILPREAEEGRFAWIAPWPTVGKPPFLETKVLSASLSVLSNCLLIVMDELGWYRSERAPLFLPNLMEPMGGMQGAMLDAEFNPRVTRWIGPAEGRSLPEVAVVMREVLARLHGRALAEDPLYRYIAMAGEHSMIELRLPFGECACMHTDRAWGIRLRMTSHNIDTSDQQLTMLAALIKIAELIEEWEWSEAQKKGT